MALCCTLARNHPALALRQKQRFQEASMERLVITVIPILAVPPSSLAFASVGWVLFVVVAII